MNETSLRRDDESPSTVNLSRRPRAEPLTALAGAVSGWRRGEAEGHTGQAGAAPALRNEVIFRRGGASRRQAWTVSSLLEGAGFAWLRFGLDVVLSFVAVFVARLGSTVADVSLFGGGWVWAFPALLIGMFWARGLYDRSVRVVLLDRAVMAVGAISVACMGIILLEAVVASEARPGALVARLWVCAVVFVVSARVALGLVQRQARARGFVGRPTLIVGAGHVGAQVARRIEDYPEYGLRPVGFLDADPIGIADSTDRRVAVLGGPEDLRRVVREVGAEHVILAFSSAPDRGLVPLTRECELLGLEVSLVPRLFESINDRVALERLGGLPLLGLRSVDPKGWQFTLKYALDRVSATIGLLACLPVLAVVAVAVKLSSPGPVFFRQKRMGRDGQEFEMLKFRSMRAAPPDLPGFIPVSGSAPGGIEGVDRRTTVGRFLRRTSLDELPQLYNVLRGDMSMIGPRPERPEFVELFRQDLDRYADRHRVKSGITGWAQVHGLRGQTSLSERVEWDNFYIENWSLWLDVKILLLTLGAVFKPGE